MWGTWGRLRNAAAKLGGDELTKRWLAMVGYQFEAWAKRLLEESAALGRFADSLCLSPRAGDVDEVSDIVVVGDGVVLLIDAKASPVPGERERAAATPRMYVDWLDSFLFGVGDKERRGGVVVQLDRLVRRIRSGAFTKRGIAADVMIVPAILTLAPVSDSAALYDWIDTRCITNDLLTIQPGVLPVSIFDCNDYELLLAVGARGGRLPELVRFKVLAARHLPMNAFLRCLLPESTNVRLPSQLFAWEKITESLHSLEWPVPRA
jgi:hypothetical protein